VSGAARKVARKKLKNTVILLLLKKGRILLVLSVKDLVIK
jgi:hypothetical protein